MEGILGEGENLFLNDSKGSEERDFSAPEKMAYEPFDPEKEVKKIGQMPKEEKKEAIEKFKQDYIAQRVGILKLHREIDQKIEENPDIPREELNQLIAVFAEELRLSSGQLERMSGILDYYEIVHQKVKRLRETYPDDRDLFKEIAGKKPKGHLEVMETPVTLHFMCEDFRDFALGTGVRGGFIWNKYNYVKGTRGQKNVDRDGITFEKLDFTDMLASKYYRFRYGKKPHLEMRAKTKEHEMRHQVFAFFKDMKELDVIKSGEEHFYVAPTLKEKESVAGRLFRNLQLYFADATGEEILNIYIEENPELFFSEKAKDNFFVWYAGKFFEKQNRLLSSLDNHAETKELSQLKITIYSSVLKIVDMHKKDIEAGVAVVKDLQEAGFAKEEILNILGSENLKKWPKLARRLMEKNAEKNNLQKQ